MNTKSTGNHFVALSSLAHEVSEPESRFQALWNEAERLKRENIELESALDQLIVRIKNSVGPIEMDMGRAMRVQIDKLIVYGGRKSLPQWQLHVLDDWIMSNMDFLQSIGMVDDELSDSLATLQAKTLGFEIDASCELSASDQLAAYMESQARELEAQFQDDESVDDADAEQEIFRWYEEQFSQSEFEELFGGQVGSESEQLNAATEAQNIDPTQPQTVFKTLFHRVARALHPDKEADPEQREFKQGLMAQLLEARRQRDLMLVFQLYREHVDDNATFDLQELAELEKILCQFIELESQRQLDITTKTQLHDIAYTQFYSDDPEEVDAAIAQKIQDVKQRKREIEAFSKTVTSLQKLRPYLEDRFEQLRQYF